MRKNICNTFSKGLNIQNKELINQHKNKPGESIHAIQQEITQMTRKKEEKRKRCSTTLVISKIQGNENNISYLSD